MISRIVLVLFASCLSVATGWSYSFSVSTLQGVSFTTTTSLQFGPDNRLYVAQVDGVIKALTVQRVAPNNYQVTATETINLVRDIPNYDDTGVRNTSIHTRQVTGLLVVGTAASPVIYVTSSDPRIGGGSGGNNDLNLDTNSGVISRLTKSGSTWTKVDIVRGLPRSEENHSPNGMQLDPLTNVLYLGQGGNTNAGGPSINFAYMCETALSAAVLSIDLNAINAMPVLTDAYGQSYIYNLPTLDDPNPSRAHNPDGSNLNDPFGGNDGLNQAKLVAGGPVQVYASGFRNPYDLVITRAPGREGRMYAFDNGANPGWGGYPMNEGANNVTNEYVAGEPGTVNNRDNLHLIPARGFYAGHPNPVRANPTGAGWLHFDNTKPEGSQMIYSLTPTTDWPSVPAELADPTESDFRQPGVDDGALLTAPASTNGIAEYVATNFSGAMQGNLLASSYDGRLFHIALNADGTRVTNGLETLASGFGNLPLDVTAPDPGHGAAFVGTIWVGHYSPGKVSVLEPSDFDSPGSSTCTGINSFDVDEDGDGYSNADEIANDSDPCSAAIRPQDADNDHVSDLFDNDDDNDGIDDENDPFQVDPTNGASAPVPVRYELFNDAGFGFYGVGLTGVMFNPGEDYRNRLGDDNVVAGGTAGLFTVSAAGPGLALGSSNSQKDAYQFGINSNEFTSPFVVTTRLSGPFFANAPTAAQRQGFYVGTGDQDNFVWIAVHANNGAGALEVVYELAGTVVAQNLYPLSGLSTISTLDLSFAIDPAAGTIQPRYQRDGAANPTNLGTAIHVTGAVLQSLMGPGPLAAGLFATTSSSGTPTFSATWDYFDVATTPDTAIAKVIIDPSSTSMATSSTYNAGSFKIQNLSTGGQQIQSVTIDLSTAMFKDMVFDTTGTAGDSVAKKFTPDSATAGVALASGGVTHPHNGVDSQDGFDAVDMSFTTFPANGTFAFSIDIDPTSVKGVAQPGQGDSASVSGLELIGATATVYFSDGTVHRTRVGRVENSVDGSYGWLRSDAPPKPGISFPGKPAALKSGDATQTVRVSGPPGSTVSLVTVESALYIGGVPNGGYDLDPFESNTAIKVTEAGGVIPSSGYKDFIITPTKTNIDAGFNLITATLANTDGMKGPASDALVVWYDPSFPGSGGGTDTQAPTAPGALTFSNVTASAVTVNWAAATDNVGVTGYRVSRDGAVLGTVSGLSYADAGRTANTTYTYTVVALDAAGNVSPASAGSITTAAAPGTATTIRINAGGPTYDGSSAQTWSADYGYNTGATATSTAAVTGTTDPTLYKTERFQSGATSLSYSLAIPNGAYLVRLYFAETYSGTKGVGKRVFHIDIQSARAFEDVDIYALAGGGDKALRLEKSASVTNGQLTITFVKQVENPKINAIEIIPDPATADTQAPTPPGTLTFNEVTSSAVTVNWTAATDNVAVTGYRVSRGGVALGTVTGLSYSDTGLAPSTSYNYAVTALDAAGNASTATTGTIATTAAGSTTTTVRVNSGGSSYTDSLGQTWSADSGYNTGATATSTATVTGTSEPTLFKTERYQGSTTPLNYTFALANGSYTVRLLFAETYSATQGVGKRVFDIDLQSARAFEDVDIYALSGGANKVLVLEKTVNVTNGQLAIGFVKQVQNPKINAIEILPAVATDTQAPSSPGTLAFSDVSANSITVNWTAAADNVGVAGYEVSRGSSVLTTVAGLSFTDSGLSAGTSYTYSVVAFDAAGNRSNATTGTIATTSASTASTIRVNAGGTGHTDPTGLTWAADTGYNSGATATYTATVTGTTAPALFKSERFQFGSTPLAYTFSVPNGQYTVRLHFAETYSGAKSVGKRIFDIDIQSARAFEDVDIYALAGGGDKAIVLEKSASVTNGQIKIGFVKQVENPKINAIEIIPVPAVAVRVNAGGSSYTSGTGETWSADTGYNTGGKYTVSTTVSGTNDPTLYKTERFQSSTTPLAYTLPVPNGNYTVRLLLAETYSGTQGVGKRVFDVDIQGARAFEDVDIYALAGGGNKALVLEKIVTVTTGEVKIGFVKQVENPKINAIEVVSAP